MTYDLIEALSDDLAVFGGQTLPAQCIVEDADALRIFVTSSRRFRAATWARAASAGAVAIYTEESGPRWATAEAFLDDRIEHKSDQTYEIPFGSTVPCDGPIPYRHMNLPEPSSLWLPGKGFVHLHAHSEYSPLDGLSTVQEMVDLAVADGQEALAITDHGICSSHPELQIVTIKAGIKPIFGIEANFVDDRFARGAEKPEIPAEPDMPHPYPGLKMAEMTDQQRAVTVQWNADRQAANAAWTEQRQELLDLHAAAQKQARDYYHLILWAMDDAGLRNLWAMSTSAYLEGSYYRPRIDWEILERYNEGVMASTACLRGPIMSKILKEDEQGARENLGRLLNIFGDRLYSEIHTNQLEMQKTANEEVIKLANEFSVPIIAVVDSHYPCTEDQHTHQVWLASQTNSDLNDDGDLFAGHQDYSLMGVEQVRFELGSTLQTDRPLPTDVIEEAIANTLLVAERCTASLKPRVVMPIYSRVGNFESDDDRIRADIKRVQALALGTPEDGYANFIKRCGGKRNDLSVYMERYETEMALLVSQNYCGYFLMAWRQVAYAKEQGLLVGPGRGSGGGCLVAYLLGIVEIDPVDADLLFERFLTEGRNEPPDFDVDYPTSGRDLMQDFCSEEWGAEHTMRVGTHLRLKNKGVFQSLGRIYKDEVDYKDFAEIAKIIDRAESGSAGLGMSWDDLWAQHGEELEPYREKYAAIFELAERLKGRLKSYGRHAAGLIVSPDEVLTDNLPMRTSDNSHQPISQFDMDALTMLGYIKFDILTLRTLDTLQVCIDMIEARSGERVNVYDWRQEYEDPQVWDEICEGNTLGIFQIETSAGTKLTKQFKPRTVGDLADIITLVRPGPVRSGLTASYFRRREGFEEVALPDPRLAEVLAPTQGCIIYQEQVMKTCQLLGGYSLTEADKVRKILGKKKVEMVEAAGIEFIQRCDEGGMDRGNAEALWEQLGEFAKYSFNKSHAYAYAVMGYWTAWFKFHYPIEFLTAVLSTVDKKRIPEFINEARRMGYKVLPPDVNESSLGFTAGTLACRYGFDGVEGVADAATTAITEAQPYTSFEDFLERKGKAANKGVVKTLARVGAFDSFGINRRALVEQLEWADSEDGTRCQNKDDTVVAEHGLPCTFDWEGEPVELGVKGRPKKKKPPPKRCTKACRQYTPPVEPDWASMENYSAADVRDIEKELLGIYLSSTPFDVIQPSDLAELCTGSDVDNGPPGDYPIAAIISRVRPHTDRNGNEMAFLGFYAQDFELDVTVFKDTWATLQSVLVKDALCLAIVRKNHRGITLDSFIPVNAR